MNLLDSVLADWVHFFESIGMAKSKDQRLYDASYSFLGTDASPADIAPDEYGCAESLSKVVQKALPELRFPTILATWILYDHFTKSPSFQQIDKPEPHCIVLSVTGTGNGRVPNGHVGIIGENKAPDGSYWIMSNNSYSGTWEVTGTLNAWNRYYQIKGGMPTLYFRVV